MIVTNVSQELIDLCNIENETIQDMIVTHVTNTTAIIIRGVIRHHQHQYRYLTIS